MMKRAIQLAIGLMLASAGLWAQISTVRVGTSIEGPYFFVDGRQYNSTQIFLWPLGSKHVLQFLLSVNPEDNVSVLPYQAGNSANIRYAFGGWRTNGPNLSSTSNTELTVTATPDVTQITGQIQASHKVRFQFSSNALSTGTCDLSAPSPSKYGFIYVDGTCFGDTVEAYMTTGPHQLTAVPFPGYVFTGFSINGQVNPSSAVSFNIQGAVEVRPQFMPAKRIKLTSEPTGLKVIVDGTTVQLPPGPPRDLFPSTNFSYDCTPAYARLPVVAPAGTPPMCIGDFDFLPGSVHKFGAPQSQMDDTGLWWVFSGFSNGLKQNDSYVVDQNVGTPDAFVAKFVTGVPATLLTNPPGLKLEVDGRQNWPNYNFMWGAGEKHTLTAPATQVDGKGRRYRFIGWANTKDISQEVTVPDDRFGISMTANYQILGQVQVTSDPVGVKLTVDGVPCTTPCTFDKDSGETLEVSAVKTIPNTTYTRYDFTSWSNGDSELAQALTFDSDVHVLRAVYRRAFRLVAQSDPPGQVEFGYTPSSPDGFFAEGTKVTVKVTPKPGFKFRRWDGNLSGTFSSGFLDMLSPRDIIARLDKVPFISSTGIKNAAGDTPENVIAPGSIVAIYGENLADALEVGPASPLAQALGNITVTVNDRLLPLMFVSPKQINALIPSDFADGKYTLKVKGPAEIPGEFTVRRNAPGLFTQQNPDNLALALAFHENGTPISMDSKAKRGETVTFYGTGFGPYDRRVVDGFPVPSDVPYRLADPIIVLAGEKTLYPAFTGAAPGMVGTAIMKLKVADDLPSNAELTVEINGAHSNTVLLPIE